MKLMLFITSGEKNRIIVICCKIIVRIRSRSLRGIEMPIKRVLKLMIRRSKIARLAYLKKAATWQCRFTIATSFDHKLDQHSDHR